jgi:hypothetical protein
MYFKRTIIALLVLVALVGIHQTVIASHAAVNTICTIDFEASIHSGPNAGLDLRGNLTLTIDPSGAVTGILSQPSDGDLNVIGQVNGLAINLALELAPDTYIFGVGTLTHNISDCTGQIGGLFAGPQAGDLGDWGYGIGG